MSRGGFRGGGRGGRGGSRGGRSGPPLPWESDEVDGRPSETFPPYAFKPAGALTDAETRYLTNFLLYQRQIHEGPLYTKKHTLRDPTRPRRIYDQQQRNRQYAVKSKATTDVFTAVETWSSRFKPNERNLPDFSSRPYVKRMFPAELHETLDGADGPRKKGGAQGDRKLKLSTATSLPTAEEVFMMNGAKGGEALMKKLELGEMGGEEGGQEEGAYDSEAVEEEEEDYAYDDEDAGDYDAEAYFDDGDGDGDDGDDGGDDGGYY
ncbi:hypothetical protein SAPIO_CDS1514 [Scedosporium apiospermum]|uniref:DNA-directed RNA polymerase III subunit n=1 Tax=Pseudallescheria apiosperma TaxID=563466 RepID=A0A084GEG5_PSEDA|nr:uncharacterized protein SAPIO_CDS1514 [Scedosporium apiospermum]KEZ45727.1 hypothetical protein SAPIO_CDS1514 [Scedosporium apiospermum]